MTDFKEYGKIRWRDMNLDNKNHWKKIKKEYRFLGEEYLKHVELPVEQTVPVLDLNVLVSHYINETLYLNRIVQEEINPVGALADGGLFPQDLGRDQLWCVQTDGTIGRAFTRDDLIGAFANNIMPHFKFRNFTRVVGRTFANPNTGETTPLYHVPHVSGEAKFTTVDNYSPLGGFDVNFNELNVADNAPANVSYPKNGILPFTGPDRERIGFQGGQVLL